MCFRPCAHLTPGCYRRNGTGVAVPSGCSAATARRDGSPDVHSGRANLRLGRTCQSVRLPVVGFGPTGPIDFNGLTIDFALDGNQGVEELVGDVGKDGGATRGDTILDDEDQELGKELVDLLGGLQVIELAEEVGGKVDVNGLSGLELQRSMAKTKTGTDGAKAALPSGEGEVMAFRIGFDQRRRRVGAEYLGIHVLSFLGWVAERRRMDLLQGYTPVTIERVWKLLIPGGLRERRDEKERVSQ